MMRYITPLACVALLTASLFACAKPGATERQKEMKASEEAVLAQTEAQQKAQKAQVTADKDIAAAQAELEKSREDYRHARRLDLADLDQRIAGLEADATTASGKAKANLDARLPVIRAGRTAFVRDMTALDTVTAPAWDSAKSRLDKEWDALKASVDQAG
jgi:hypothetical protein